MARRTRIPKALPGSQGPTFACAPTQAAGVPPALRAQVGRSARAQYASATAQLRSRGCNASVGAMRLAVLVLALVVACGSKQHRADVDLAHVEQLIATRIAEVLARPDVARAFDAFLDGVLAAPEIDKASDGLVDMLGRDQNLVGTAERMLDMLRQLPALQSLIREVTVAHPYAN